MNPSFADLCYHCRLMCPWCTVHCQSITWRILLIFCSLLYSEYYGLCSDTILQNLRDEMVMQYYGEILVCSFHLYSRLLLLKSLVGKRRSDHVHCQVCVSICSTKFCLQVRKDKACC